jgi:hypothetical protein
MSKSMMRMNTMEIATADEIMSRGELFVLSSSFPVPRAILRGMTPASDVTEDRGRR